MVPGKLFGSFNGPGIHGTALYFSQLADLHPGGSFAALGGLIQFSEAELPWQSRSVQAWQVWPCSGTW